MLIDDLQVGLTYADKTIMYTVVSCVIAAVRFDCPLFYNFALGSSVGGMLFHYMSIYFKYKRMMKTLEKEEKDNI